MNKRTMPWAVILFIINIKYLNLTRQLTHIIIILYPLDSNKLIIKSIDKLIQR